MIVIGAGSGGLSIGLSLHELGFKVLLIDKSDQTIGGECLNNGCVPSKALIHVSRMVHQAKASAKFGLEVAGEVDLDAVMEYVRKGQDVIRGHENKAFFEGQGLEVALGSAKFVGKDAVQVGDKVYRGKKIAIATGSKPRKLRIPAVEQVAYYDNESVFDMVNLPKRLLVVGAGPISLELGQAFGRLGAEVTVVEMLDRILINETSEMADVLYQRLVEEGLQFHFGYKATEFKDAQTVVIEDKAGERKELSFDAVLVGIGRVLNFEALDLGKAGIAINERGGIITDAYMRTSNKKVYVIGDALASLQFSHGAEWQATVMVNNFLSPFKKKLQYKNFSWVTFTDPEVATFGMSEKQLKEKGVNYEKLELDFSDDDRAIVGHYRYSKMILLVKKGLFDWGDKKLLGGTMVAPNAGEMFQELVLAQSAGLGIRALFNKIYPYPTGARVNKTIVLNHYLKTVKPWMKRIFKLLYH